MSQGDIHAVIVAGGSGQRMKHPLPKQFHLLGDVPVIIRSIRVFLQADKVQSITVAIHPEWIEHLQNILDQLLPGQAIHMVPGGATRFDSVKNALSSIKGAPDELVLIHDGVRPFVSGDLIDRVYSEVRSGHGVIPVLPVRDSLRQMKGQESRPIDRGRIVRVQTPQGFLLEELQEAYRQEYQDYFTDDASVFESAGGKILTVEGEEKNMKITGSFDMEVARCIAEREKN